MSELDWQINKAPKPSPALWSRREAKESLLAVERYEWKDATDRQPTRGNLMGHALWADARFRLLHYDQIASGISAPSLALETGEGNRQYIIALYRAAIVSHPDTARPDGKWLAGLRSSFGMTQRELADLLSIKKNSVSRWESETRPVTAQRIKDFRRIFLPAWRDDVAAWETLAVLHDLKRFHDDGTTPKGLVGTESLNWMFDTYEQSPTVLEARSLVPSPPWLEEELETLDYEDIIGWAKRMDSWWPGYSIRTVYKLPPQPMEPEHKAERHSDPTADADLTPDPSTESPAVKDTKGTHVEAD